MGKEDGWKDDENKTFVSEEDVDNIFENFDIVYFNEKKYSRDTASGKMKFGHVYEVIAKKVR